MSKFQLNESVIDLIVESWKLNKFTKNLTNGIADPLIRKKGLNHVARFDKHFRTTLENLNLEVLDFTGAEFEIGLPIHPINLDDFAADEILVVEMMLAPTIKVADSAEIVNRGTAVLGRKFQ